MTKHEELERDAENLARSLLPMTARVARRDDREGSAKTCEVAASTILALLSANREMREALEFYADEPAREFPSDGPWGVNSDDFGRVARSALTTQRGG